MDYFTIFILILPFWIISAILFIGFYEDVIRDSKDVSNKVKKVLLIAGVAVPMLGAILILFSVIVAIVIFIVKEVREEIKKL